MPNKSLPKIAIVGRPNVGKSSLFNRIVGSRKAIVESASGTTRDRIYADIKRKGKHFTVIDTGGFDEVSRDEMTALVLKQLETAVKEADIIFFVVDGTAGVMHQDTELAGRLRKTSKKIYLVVNKIDDKTRQSKTLDFFELGLGEPYAISAVNGLGIEKLLDDVASGAGGEALKHAAGIQSIKVAIVGRPNVGKSSYLNAILNEERAIVHPIAGTTRDAVDMDFEYRGKHYCLIDTAGMRHNTKLKTASDFYGSVRSREAIERSDVAVVIIDGLEGLREDDERVIEFCIDKGKALVIAVNKWDLVKGVDTAKYKEMLIKKMNAIRNFPVLFTSCKTGREVVRSLDLVLPLYEKMNRVFGKNELDGMLGKLNNSPEIRNRRLKFEYLNQEGARPPRFILGIKNPKLTNENLKRYIENFLRSAYNFEGVPIRVRFEKRVLKK